MIMAIMMVVMDGGDSDYGDDGVDDGGDDGDNHGELDSGEMIVC